MSPGQPVLDLSGHSTERQVEVVRVGPALARSTDPDTSRAAAAKQRGGAEAEILRLFRVLSWKSDGLTDDEITTRLPHLNPPSAKSARSRLLKHGYLVDSGLRRPSLRGSQMIAWRLA